MKCWRRFLGVFQVYFAVEFLIAWLGKVSVTESDGSRVFFNVSYPVGFRLVRENVYTIPVDWLVGSGDVRNLGAHAYALDTMQEFWVRLDEILEQVTKRIELQWSVTQFRSPAHTDCTVSARLMTVQAQDYVTMSLLVWTGFEAYRKLFQSIYFIRQIDWQNDGFKALDWQALVNYLSCNFHEASNGAFLANVEKLHARVIVLKLVYVFLDFLDFFLIWEFVICYLIVRRHMAWYVCNCVFFVLKLLNDIGRLINNASLNAVFSSRFQERPVNKPSG
jgi:hypothetical protein